LNFEIILKHNLVLDVEWHSNQSLIDDALIASFLPLASNLQLRKPLNLVASGMTWVAARPVGDWERIVSLTFNPSPVTA
jgi:hypothetical protein